jgi:hypothetical protein
VIDPEGLEGFNQVLTAIVQVVLLCLVINVVTVVAVMVFARRRDGLRRGLLFVLTLVALVSIEVLSVIAYLTFTGFYSGTGWRDGLEVAVAAADLVILATVAVVAAVRVVTRRATDALG